METHKRVNVQIFLMSEEIDNLHIKPYDDSFSLTRIDRRAMRPDL